VINSLPTGLRYIPLSCSYKRTFLTQLVQLTAIRHSHVIYLFSSLNRQVFYFSTTTHPELQSYTKPNPSTHKASMNKQHTMLVGNLTIESAVLYVIFFIMVYACMIITRYLCYVHAFVQTLMLYFDSWHVTINFPVSFVVF